MFHSARSGQAIPMIFAGPIVLSPSAQREIFLVFAAVAFVLASVIAACVAVILRALVRWRGRSGHGVFGAVFVIALVLQLGASGAYVAVVTHEHDRSHLPQPTKIAPGTVVAMTPGWLEVDADDHLSAPMTVVAGAHGRCEPVPEARLLQSSATELVVQLQVTVPDSSTDCVFGMQDREVDLPEHLGPRDLVIADQAGGMRFRDWGGGYVACDGDPCTPPDSIVTSTTIP